jgi:CRP/FNR family transcriptional regulator
MLGMRKSTTYPPGKPLFSCGQPTRGIYLVEKGRIKLFLCSDTTGTAFDEVGPGAVLALSEAISGGPHKLTAVAVDCAHVAFVTRDDLLPFLQQNQLFCMQLVQLLSEDLHLLYHRFRNSTAAGPMTKLKPNPHGLSCRERPN